MKVPQNCLHFMWFLHIITAETTAIIRNVITSAQFQEALKSVQPGDYINAQPGDVAVPFRGRFVAASNGTLGSSITITGISIEGQGETEDVGLIIKGDYWIIQGIKIHAAELIIKGNNNYLNASQVSGRPKFGLFLFGNRNRVENCVFTADKSNGTGVMVSGNENSLEGIKVSAKTAIYFGEDSCCGRINEALVSTEMLFLAEVIT
ncbi:unnamed protein product [Orchesella dallaii]|uniref:Uncharacterized protein n=1 Tax=Orchesella dallaii TaxID=48710 RepID=A0ABP1RPK3_9HEXA